MLEKASTVAVLRIKDHLEKLTSERERVMVVGCSNGTVPEELQSISVEIKLQIIFMFRRISCKSQ